MQKQQGMVLLVVLLWFAVITVTIAALAGSAREQGVLLRAHMRSAEAFHLAQRGLICAHAVLASGPSASCGQIAGAHFTIIPVLAGKPAETYFKVTATGVSHNITAVLQALEELLPTGEVKQLWWRQVGSS